MTPAGQVAGIVLVLVALVGGGAVIGRQSRDAEVAQLIQERDATFAHANRQAETLTNIKATLRDERERRSRIERAIQQELADRAERIAKLEVAAERRRQKINTEATKDENCTALRHMPVCAAIADGLWGSPPASSTH